MHPPNLAPLFPGVILQDFFRELSWRQTSLGVTSLQLSMTTLEDVFLRIARMAELEVAAAEGRYATVALPSGVIIKVGTAPVASTAATPMRVRCMVPPPSLAQS